MDELDKRTKELRILKHISRIVGSTTSISVLVKKMSQVVHDEFIADMVFVVVYDDDQLVIKNIDESRPLNPDFSDVVYYFAEQAIKDASPIVMKTGKGDEYVRQFGVYNVIVAPLMLYDGPIGAIVVMNQRAELSRFNVRVLNSIAVQSADAINKLALHKKIEEKDKAISNLYTKLYEKEAKKAVTDSLTGMFNKSYFVEKLSEMYDQTPSLILFDVDFFKNYNDSFGHQQGDIVLKKIGQIVKKLGIGIPCRYGGEEFAILLPNTDLEDALKIAERVRKEIEALYYAHKLGRIVTASFGVGQKEYEEDLENFVDKIDKALYKAKQYGRNRVMVAEE